MKYLKQSLAAFFAVAGMAAHANDGAVADEPKTLVRGFGSFSTVLVKGEDAAVGEDNIARFNVRLNGSAMAAYPASSRLAVVFDEAMMKQSEVQCPVIDITGRRRKLEEIKPGIIAVEAAVTPEEKTRVMRARCVVVTPSPSIGEFKFLPRDSQNNDSYMP